MALTDQEKWTARNFIGALVDTFDPDQSYSSQDASTYNPTRQYTVIGPNGNGLEGGTGRMQGGLGLSLSPAMLMVGAALVAAFLIFKKG